MKLRRLSAKNYRSLHEEDIELGEIEFVHWRQRVGQEHYSGHASISARRSPDT